MNATAQNRRFMLRQRTAAAHQALDDAVGAWNDESQYRAYVAGLARFRLPVETTLASVEWGAPFGAWRPRLIGEALRVDARHLGIDADVRAGRWNEVDLPELLGLLYVLEGSALGARLLVRRAAQLGFGSDSGASHLATLSRDLDNWQGFLDLLESSEAFDIDRTAIGAIAAFRFAQNAFMTDFRP